MKEVFTRQRWLVTLLLKYNSLKWVPSVVAAKRLGCIGVPYLSSWDNRPDLISNRTLILECQRP